MLFRVITNRILRLVLLNHCIADRSGYSIPSQDGNVLCQLTAAMKEYSCYYSPTNFDYAIGQIFERRYGIP